MSGRSRSAVWTASTPSRGLGDDLHVGLAVQQQPQPAAHDAVVVGDEQPHRAIAPRARTVSSTVVPPPGVETISRRPPASIARSRMPSRPEPPSRSRSGGEAVAVVDDRHRAAARRCSPSTVTLTVARVGVARDVRQRLLHDAVDDELLDLAEQRPRPVGGEARRDAPALAERRDLRAQGGQRGRGRRARRGAARGPGRAARPSPGRRAAGSRRAPRRSSGGACSAVAARRSETAASAWLTSSCRSRATRARSASWARSTAVGAAGALGLQALEHAVEGVAQPGDVGGLAVLRLGAHARARRGRRAPSCVVSDSSGAKRRRMTRLLASTVARIAATSTRNWRAPAAVAEVEARGDARREHRRDDEQGVDGQHLGEQGGLRMGS